MMLDKVSNSIWKARYCKRLKIFVSRRANGQKAGCDAIFLSNVAFITSPSHFAPYHWLSIAQHSPSRQSKRLFKQETVQARDRPTAACIARQPQHCCNTTFSTIAQGREPTMTTTYGPFPPSSSLSYLLPSTPSSSYAHRQKSLAAGDGTEELRKLSRDLVKSFNARDFDRAFSYTSPKFRARHNNLAVELDRHQHFAAYKMMLTANPSWRMDVALDHAEVDLIAGQALVWIFVKITGDVEGVSRDSLGLLHWVRSRETGKWEVVYHCGFRSCGGLF